MSERLTDAELTEALEVAQGLHSLKLTAAVAELIDRRRADLTSEERDALAWLRDRVAGVRGRLEQRADRAGLVDYIDKANAASDLLNKLLGEGQR